MKYLLDTHIILWILKGEDNQGHKIPRELYDIITNNENDLYYSSISIFEIEIKRLVRPQDALPSGEEIIQLCKKADIKELSLSAEHTLLMKSLNKGSAETHKDPYDWLLVSQAKSECMKFITHDSKLKIYLEDCIMSI